MFRTKIGLGLALVTFYLSGSMNLFSQEVSFVARKDFFVGEGPISMVTADFNGDGYLDLVTANLGSNDVSLLLGDGQGDFRPAGHFAVRGTGPTWMTAGDFNGDGQVDLAITNFTSRDVAILLGDGQGRFHPVEANFPLNGLPQSIVAGDFNQDDHLDLAIATNGPEGISVLLGDGSGRFPQSRTVPVPAPVIPASGCLSVGDFNEDGNLDIVSGAVSGNAAIILLGDGEGGFMVQLLRLPCFGFCVSRNPICLTVADFNGDGHLDLALSEAGIAGPELALTISIWYGDGQGHFTQAEFIALPAFPPLAFRPAIFITTADMNNDEILDIILAHQPGSFVSVFLRDGQGGFRGTENRFYAGLAPNWIVVEDFNGDGRLDLAVANAGSRPADKTVSILLGDGEGRFITERRMRPGSFELAKGDFNNDGNLDLVTVAQVPPLGFRIVLRLGDGQGGFGEPRLFVGEGGAITTGDFNGDKNLDLAMVGGDGVLIYWGDGQGNMTRGRSFSVGPQPSFIIAEDFNRDGNLDLAVTNERDQFAAQRREPSTVSVLLGDGRGNFTRRDFPVGVSPIAMVAGDFNNDGHIDLAVANRDFFGPGSLSILLGDGRGGFQPAREINPGRYPFHIAAGDFNSDRNLDLAVSLGTDGTDIVVLFGDGRGGFSEPRRFEVGITPRAVVAGDFNGDEHLDLAAAAMLSNSVTILLGDGRGGFRPNRVRFGGGGGTYNMIAGDFNSDGKLDLVTASSGSLWLLLNDTNSSKDKGILAGSIAWPVPADPADRDRLEPSKGLRPQKARLSSFLAGLLKPWMAAFRATNQKKLH